MLQRVLTSGRSGLRMELFYVCRTKSSSSQNPKLPEKRIGRRHDLCRIPLTTHFISRALGAATAERKALTLPNSKVNEKPRTPRAPDHVLITLADGTRQDGSAKASRRVELDPTVGGLWTL